MLLDEIKEIVGNLSYVIDDIGRSDDQVILFDNKYVLKISSNKERLLREKNKIDWLNNKIKCPKSILFTEDNDKFYYLRTFVNGESLIAERFLNNPLLLIDILVNIINLLKSLDDKLCPFKSSDNIGNAFVHGDLCLPNIYVDENNEFCGFIDLDNCGLGDRWYDIAWLLWSLEYNLKTNEYNDLLLEKLNIKFDIRKYNSYIPKEYRMSDKK